MEQEDRLKTRIDELEEDWSRGTKYWNFALTSVAPTRTKACMVIYADGSGFDPGSGEGLYRRNSSNTAWVFIG